VGYSDVYQDDENIYENQNLLLDIFDEKDSSLNAKLKKLNSSNTSLAHTSKP